MAYWQQLAFHCRDVVDRQQREINGYRAQLGLEPGRGTQQTRGDGEKGGEIEYITGIVYIAACRKRGEGTARNIAGRFACVHIYTTR